MSPHEHTKPCMEIRRLIDCILQLGQKQKGRARKTCTPRITQLVNLEYKLQRYLDLPWISGQCSFPKVPIRKATRTIADRNGDGIAVGVGSTVSAACKISGTELRGRLARSSGSW